MKKAEIVKDETPSRTNEVSTKSYEKISSHHHQLNPAEIGYSIGKIIGRHYAHKVEHVIPGFIGKTVSAKMKMALYAVRFAIYSNTYKAYKTHPQGSIKAGIATGIDFIFDECIDLVFKNGAVYIKVGLLLGELCVPLAEDLHDAALSEFKLIQSVPEHIRDYLDIEDIAIELDGMAGVTRQLGKLSKFYNDLKKYAKEGAFEVFGLNSVNTFPAENVPFNQFDLNRAMNDALKKFGFSTEEIAKLNQWERFSEHDFAGVNNYDGNNIPLDNFLSYANAQFDLEKFYEYFANPSNYLSNTLESFNQPRQDGEHRPPQTGELSTGGKVPSRLMIDSSQYYNPLLDPNKFSIDILPEDGGASINFNIKSDQGNLQFSIIGIFQGWIDKFSDKVNRMVNEEYDTEMAIIEKLNELQPLYQQFCVAWNDFFKKLSHLNADEFLNGINTLKNLHSQLEMGIAKACPKPLKKGKFPWLMQEWQQQLRARLKDLNSTKKTLEILDSIDYEKLRAIPSNKFSEVIQLICWVASDNKISQIIPINSIFAISSNDIAEAAQESARILSILRENEINGEDYESFKKLLISKTIIELNELKDLIFSGKFDEFTISQFKAVFKDELSKLLNKKGDAFYEDFKLINSLNEILNAVASKIDDPEVQRLKYLMNLIESTGNTSNELLAYNGVVLTNKFLTGINQILQLLNLENELLEGIFRLSEGIMLPFNEIVRSQLSESLGKMIAAIEDMLVNQPESPANNDGSNANQPGSVTSNDGSNVNQPKPATSNDGNNANQPGPAASNDGNNVDQPGPTTSNSGENIDSNAILRKMKDDCQKAKSELDSEYFSPEKILSMTALIINGLGKIVRYSGISESKFFDVTIEASQILLYSISLYHFPVSFDAVNIPEIAQYAFLVTHVITYLSYLGKDRYQFLDSDFFRIISMFDHEIKQYKLVKMASLEFIIGKLTGFKLIEQLIIPTGIIAGYTFFYGFIAIACVKAAIDVIFRYKSLERLQQRVNEFESEFQKVFKNQFAKIKEYDELYKKLNELWEEENHLTRSSQTHHLLKIREAYINLRKSVRPKDAKSQYLLAFKQADDAYTNLETEKYTGAQNRKWLTDKSAIQHLSALSAMYEALFKIREIITTRENSIDDVPTLFIQEQADYAKGIQILKEKLRDKNFLYQFYGEVDFNLFHLKMLFHAHFVDYNEAKKIFSKTELRKSPGDKYFHEHFEPQLVKLHAEFNYIDNKATIFFIDVFLRLVMSTPLNYHHPIIFNVVNIIQDLIFAASKEGYAKEGLVPIINFIGIIGIDGSISLTRSTWFIFGPWAINKFSLSSIVKKEADSVVHAVLNLSDLSFLLFQFCKGNGLNFHELFFISSQLLSPVILNLADNYQDEIKFNSSISLSKSIAIAYLNNRIASIWMRRINIDFMSKLICWNYLTNPRIRAMGLISMPKSALIKFQLAFNLMYYSYGYYYQDSTVKDRATTYVLDVMSIVSIEVLASRIPTPFYSVGLILFLSTLGYEAYHYRERFQFYDKLTLVNDLINSHQYQQAKNELQSACIPIDLFSEDRYYSPILEFFIKINEKNAYYVNRCYECFYHENRINYHLGMSDMVLINIHQYLKSQPLPPIQDEQILSLLTLNYYAVQHFLAQRKNFLQDDLSEIDRFIANVESTVIKKMESSRQHLLALARVRLLGDKALDKAQQALDKAIEIDGYSQDYFVTQCEIISNKMKMTNILNEIDKINISKREEGNNFYLQQVENNLNNLEEMIDPCISRQPIFYNNVYNNMSQNFIYFNISLYDEFYLSQQTLLKFSQDIALYRQQWNLPRVKKENFDDIKTSSASYVRNPFSALSSSVGYLASWLRLSFIDPSIKNHVFENDIGNGMTDQQQGNKNSFIMNYSQDISTQWYTMPSYEKLDPDHQFTEISQISPTYNSSVGEQCFLLQWILFYAEKWMPCNRSRNLTIQERLELKEIWEKINNLRRDTHLLNKGILAESGFFEDKFKWIESHAQDLLSDISRILQYSIVTDTKMTLIMKTLSSMQTNLLILAQRKTILRAWEQESKMLKTKNKVIHVSYNIIKDELTKHIVRLPRQKQKSEGYNLSEQFFGDNLQQTVWSNTGLSLWQKEKLSSSQQTLQVDRCQNISFVK